MRIVGNNPTLSRQTTATASGAISAAGKPLIVNTDGTVQVAGIETLTTTVGSATTFDSNAITSTDITFDSSNNKVVVSFQSGRTGDYGVARVGTVDASNNTISFGTETVFESAAVYYTSIDFDSTNKGDTAIGNGFRLHLVISTSINANEVLGIKNNNVINI